MQEDNEGGQGWADDECAFQTVLAELTKLHLRLRRPTAGHNTTRLGDARAHAPDSTLHNKRAPTAHRSVGLRGKEG